MRLVILTQYYPPEIGAPQKRLSEMATRFAARGHQVTVLTAMPSYPQGQIYSGYGGMYRRELIDGVRIVRAWIYPTQSARMVRRLANYFSFVISSVIVGIFTIGRTDVLLVESPPLFLWFSAYVLSRIKRARLIFNVSDLWPESAVQLGVLRAGSFQHRLSTWLEGFSYRKSWLITGQSTSILASIRQRFPECRTYHLSNGVDTVSFTPARASSAARSELAEERSCIVLYAGLHGLAQGLNQILEAASALQDRTSLQFVLIGDGPEKQMLLERARDLRLGNVRFLEPRPAQEMPALVASADIVIVPLKMFIPGAVPSKLYEAMASAKPVVLVAEGEAGEIVKRYDAGIVVKPGDVDALATAISTLQSDPQLRERLGANGRRAAVESYDREKIVLAFERYLMESLEG